MEGGLPHPVFGTSFPLQFPLGLSHPTPSTSCITRMAATRLRPYPSKAINVLDSGSSPDHSFIQRLVSTYHVPGPVLPTGQRSAPPLPLPAPPRTRTRNFSSLS